MRSGEGRDGGSKHQNHALVEPCMSLKTATDNEKVTQATEIRLKLTDILWPQKQEAYLVTF